ncbi:MAG TPA: hypothetical protein VFF57_04400 [Hanamia sp.]|nr:hypothetical protein [Hanamia sp.]
MKRIPAISGVSCGGHVLSKEMDAVSFHKQYLWNSNPFFSRKQEKGFFKSGGTMVSEF